MCATCGCDDVAAVTITDPAEAHDHGHGSNHGHGHNHGHEHAHEPGSAKTVVLQQDVLAKNDRLAERNRGWLAARDICALNLMSSPGSGKTTLLERTARDLAGEIPLAVIEGDQETLRDAERIRATGCPTVQVNTGAGCHLDAEMMAGALRTLDPRDGSVLFVENVGNLVCPALFDLGEHSRVVVMSVTEGEDKPIKYPHMFRSADLLLLNKTDLLPYLDFDVDGFFGYARRMNRNLRVIQLSATKGDGMDQWYSWLKALVPEGSRSA